MRRALLTAVAVALVSTTAPAAAQPAPPAYTPPVEAAVVDGFRPPTTPFGPGNRGLEYGTEPGTPGRGRRGRAGDLRGLGRRHACTSPCCTPMGSAPPTRSCGASTWSSASGWRRATRSGSTDGHLHFGARRGDSYFDPADAVRRRARRGCTWCPSTSRPGDGRGGGAERHRSARSAARAPARGGGRRRRCGRDLAAGRRHPAAAHARPLRTALHLPGLVPRQLVDGVPGAGSAPDPRPTGRARRRAIRSHHRRTDGSRCWSPASVPHSAGSTVDQVRTDAARVRRSRCAALQLRGRAGARPLRRARGDPGLRLRRRRDPGRPPARRPAARRPPRAGGRRGAGRADRRHRPLAGRGRGAPGADRARAPPRRRLARAGGDARHPRLTARRRRPGHRGPRAGPAPRPATRCSDAVAAATDQELDDDARSIAQLAETSDVVAELADHPVPDAIDAVSIAARGDVVVPVPRSRAPGHGRGRRPAHGRRARTSDLPAQRRGHPGARPRPGRAPAGLPDLRGRPPRPGGGRGDQPRSRTWREPVASWSPPAPTCGRA